MEYVLRKYYFEESKKHIFTLDSYYKENEVNKEIWNEISKHIGDEEFKGSKKSFIQFLIFPSLFNFYLYNTKNTRYMKFILSFSCMSLFYFNIHIKLNNEIPKFIKLNKGERLKEYLNKNIKYSDHYPYFE